jgi:hypothetical protein
MRRRQAPGLSPMFRLFVFVVLVLVAFVAVTGCSTTPYGKAGVYHTLNSTQAHNPAILVGAGIKKDRWYCEYLHYSHITTGEPFNDKPDLFIDTVGCGVQYE